MYCQAELQIFRPHVAAKENGEYSVLPSVWHPDLEFVYLSSSNHQIKKINKVEKTNVLKM